MRTPLPPLLASAALAVCLLIAAVAQAPPPSPAPVTWAHDIAPIVYRSCAECHHPGGPGPFSLLAYGDAQRHAVQMQEVTESHYMPPWLPDADSGPFAHARTLPAAQAALIGRWAAQGAPQGDAHTVSPPPHFNDGWTLGKPDRVITLPHPYVLPAETSSPYRCFDLPLALPQTCRLRAIAFLPKNFTVRHAALYADPARVGRTLEAGSGAVGYTARDAGLGPDAVPLAEWAVRSGPYTLPADVAAALPAGSDLILVLRFEPDGQREDIQPKIGLYDAPPSAAEAPVSLTLGARDLILDPGQKATVGDSFTLPVAARLLRVAPHGHPICRTLQVSAGAHSLLHIGDWNADWADAYPFTAPPVLPAGTVLRVRWTADNTPANPRNPMASPMTVMPGLLYLDDMATVRLELAPVSPADAPRLLRAVQSPRPDPILLTTAPSRHG